MRELENFGLIKRTIVNRRPVQTEYSLKEKGMALEPILAHIPAFSARYDPKKVFKDGKSRNSIQQIFNADSLSRVYD